MARIFAEAARLGTHREREPLEDSGMHVSEDTAGPVLWRAHDWPKWSRVRQQVAEVLSAMPHASVRDVALRVGCEMALATVYMREIRTRLGQESEPARLADERREAARRMLRAEPLLANTTIAERCGCSPRTVRELRAEMRIAPVVRGGARMRAA